MIATTAASASLTGLTPASSTLAAAASSGGGLNLTSADFEKLLIAQLQNENPTSPTNPQDLESEFASLSTVSDLATLNSQVSSIQAGGSAAQIAQAAGLVGHQVAFDGNTLTAGSNGSASGGFNIAAAANVIVSVTNAAGAAVGSVNLGNLAAGQHNFTWGGGSANSSYNFAVSAVDTGGAAVTATPYSVGTVQSVNLSGTTPALNIAGSPAAVPSSQITSVLGG
jgi:flagellar basal-body rod modification protein FlgD